MSCQKECFEAVLPACSDFIILRAGLPANTQFYWRIIDRHGGIYQRLVTTDSSGDLEIKADSLPPGALNKYSGNWNLEIRFGGDYLQKVVLTFDDKQYTCVQMSFTDFNQEVGDDSETNVIKGTSAAVPPISAPSDYLIKVVSADFSVSSVPDATHIENSLIVGKDLEIFFNDASRYLTTDEWEATPEGINITIPGFDATANNYTLYIFIK